MVPASVARGAVRLRRGGSRSAGRARRPHRAPAAARRVRRVRARPRRPASDARPSPGRAGCPRRRRRGLGGADAGWPRRRVGGEQFRVQPLQLAARIHAKFVRDHLPRLGVHLKRLGPPSRVLKCPHQQRPEPLPQRVLRHQAAQLRHHLRRPAAREVRLDAQLGRGEPQLRRAVWPGSRAAGTAGRRRAAARATARAPRRAARRRAPDRRRPARPCHRRRATRTPGCPGRPVRRAAGTRAPGRRAPGPRCRR